MWNETEIDNGKEEKRQIKIKETRNKVKEKQIGKEGPKGRGRTRERRNKGIFECVLINNSMKQHELPVCNMDHS